MLFVYDTDETTTATAVATKHTKKPTKKPAKKPITIEPTGLIVEALAGSGKTSILLKMLDYYRGHFNIDRMTSDLPFKSFTPTTEQQAILRCFACVLDGVGLTYDKLRQPATQKALVFHYLAFGAAFKAEAAPKFAAYPGTNRVMTTHQFGLDIIKTKINPDIKVTTDNSRLKTLIAKYPSKYGIPSGIKPWDVAWLIKVLEWCRNGILTPDTLSIKDILECADNMGEPKINESWLKTYHSCINRLYPVTMDIEQEPTPVSQVDFGDMINVPKKYIMDYVNPRDVFAIDEFQDMNHSQLTMVQYIAQAGGIIVAVGDPNQSIFAFRSGITRDSITTLKECYPSWPVLSMTVSQRTPVIVAKAASLIVPEFKPRESAPEGVIMVTPDLDTKITNVIKQMRSMGMEFPLMVLSRTNAALLSMALKLFAVPEGPDKIVFHYRAPIEAALTKAIESMFKTFADKCKALNSFQVPVPFIINNWESNELSKLSRGQVRSMDRIQNYADCIRMIWEYVVQTELYGNPVQVNAHNVDVVQSYMHGAIAKLQNTLRTKNPDLVLHTVHSAKGMESDVVCIIDCGSMPHPLAQKPHELQQEQNIIYIALTRSKSMLLMDMDLTKGLMEGIDYVK